MASSNRRDLYLQVDGNIDPLRRATKAAAGVLVDFKGDVSAQLKAIEDNFASLGGEKLDQNLRQIENSFRKTFAAINANAASAGKDITPTAVLNVQGAQQAVALAERQAAALRVVADEAGQLAIRINDADSAEAQFARASLAAALAKEQEAAQLRVQADVLGRLQAQLGQTANAQQRVTNVTGSQRVGLQQLSFQVGDVASQFSSGTPVLQIFAQQAGQTVQAIGLMTAETGGLLGFLGGPYGQILTAATVLTIGLAASHERGADAVVVHKNAADQLEASLHALESATASSNHETLIGINLDIEAAKRKRELTIATIQQRNAQSGVSTSVANTFLGRGLLSDRGGSVGPLLQGGLVAGPALVKYFIGQSADSSRKDLAAINTDIAGGIAKKIIGDVASETDAATKATTGFKNAVDALQRKFEEKGFGDPNSPGAQKAFHDAVLQATNQRDAALTQSRTAGDADQAIAARRQQIADLEKLRATATGKDLDKINKAIALREKQIQYLQEGVGVSSATAATTGGGGRGRRGPSAETLAERAANNDRAYQGELDRAQQDLARAQLALVDTAEARYKVDTDALRSAQVQRDAEIADEVRAGKISAAQAQTLVDLNARSTSAKLQKALEDEQVAIAQRKRDADLRELDGQIGVLQAQSQLATTNAARRDIALKLLALEEQRQRLEAQALAGRGYATGNAELFAQGVSQLQQVDALHPYRVQQVQQQTASPIDQYRQQVRNNINDMGDALQRIEVDGFQNFEDSASRALGNTATRFLHLNGVIGQFVSQAIADFARLEIEKLFFAPLLGLKGGSLDLGAPGFATGMIPGFADGIISGPGTGTSDSILAMLGNRLIRVSNGESIINAASTRRYRPLLKAINDNSLPGFADGLVAPSMPPIFYPPIPSSADLALRAPAPAPIVFDLRGAVMTSELLQQMNNIAAQHATVAAITASQDAQAQIASRSRRQIS